jgi:hypothetical protein
MANLKMTGLTRLTGDKNCAPWKLSPPQSAAPLKLLVSGVGQIGVDIVGILEYPELLCPAEFGPVLLFTDSRFAMIDIISGGK